MTLKLTPKEVQMLEEGYVSARMIAAKVGQSPMTIRKSIAAHPDELESVRMGRVQVFYSIKSVKKKWGPLFQIVDFDDWKDIVERLEKAPRQRKAS